MRKSWKKHNVIKYRATETAVLWSTEYQAVSQLGPKIKFLPNNDMQTYPIILCFARKKAAFDKQNKFSVTVDM